ncbi:biosynthetic-type acetolactate synthase large subunit [Bacillus sp. JJ1764]|uniref:biosynthetic-type acetolactate synthase large subunit n=1 Tax=Bacillus sp. JJ1764 TaxID=3122964 RepID=UPI002FFFCFF1
MLNEKTVTQLFESLGLLGVDCVFGCDADLLNPALHPTVNNEGIRYFQMKHEQSAVHAADGFARATGRPGVVLLTSPSGITNGITGIATAYSDSIPLVIIAGPLHTGPINNDTMQELDISGITMPITKETYEISQIKDLDSLLSEALKVAAFGRPGPVLIALKASISLNSKKFTLAPIDSNDKINEDIFPKKYSGNRWNNGSKHRENQITPKNIEKVKDMIERARKPVIFIGGGIIASDSSEELREVVKHARIPVVSSLMGIGAMEANDPLYLGMLGMHGTFAANKAVHHCDLLISIGVRFSDRVTGKISGFSPKSKKIHIDIDSAEINKIVTVDLPITGDAKQFLKAIKSILDYQQIQLNTEIWTNEVIEWKRTVPRFDKSNSILSPQTVIRLLRDSFGKDTVVITDVGQHQIWTAHHYAFSKPRTLITSGGLGTMGFGLPAAIGAAAACPEQPVICVSGDGSFQMNLQELMTVVKYQLPIKLAIMNNGYLGMVRQWQELFYQGRYSAVKMTSPHFVKLAEAYGVAGLSAQTEDQAKHVIRTAFQTNGPVLMEFNVIEEENVYPMVPPNHNNHQAILSR